MAVRKSKKIGQIINGYEIIDSKHFSKDTKYLVKCTECGYTAYKSRTFVKNGAKCPNCSKGKNYHNVKGFQDERLYQRYVSILRKIKSNEHYKNVKMCKEWEDDYLLFRQWALEHGYKDELTIDRIDNKKGYSPDNCRWISLKGQANNRSNNKILYYEGRAYTISEFADFCDLPYTAVLQRVNKKWELEDVVKTPYRSRKKWSEIYGKA